MYSSLRHGRGVRGLALPVAVLAVVSACSARERVAYSPSELRASLVGNLPQGLRASLVVPYEVTAELVARAQQYTDSAGTEHARAQGLTRAISNHDQFGLRWERVTTTVARDTLAAGQGNCLSLTSVYVGLARAIGLTAYYVDASDRINSLQRDQELLVRTGHIIATVRTERGWSMVDFTGEVSNYRTFRVIDDIEALAHFYNNRGYERIATAHATGEAIPWVQVMRDFRVAIAVRPDFARAHNNLGVALARTGDDDAAEAEYLAAIWADEDFAAARQNLGNLRLRHGDYADAIRWYQVAIKLESENPYLRFHLGLAQYQSGDIEASVKSFERAIALKHDYLEPRNVLAQAYRHLGRDAEADAVMRAARKQRRDG